MDCNDPLLLCRDFESRLLTGHFGVCEGPGCGCPILAAVSTLHVTLLESFLPPVNRRPFDLGKMLILSYVCAKHQKSFVLSEKEGRGDGFGAP